MIDRCLLPSYSRDSFGLAITQLWYATCTYEGFTVLVSKHGPWLFARYNGRWAIRSVGYHLRLDVHPKPALHLQAPELASQP